MRKVYNILTFLMAVLCLYSASATVSAADELPVLDRKGTITVTVMDTDTKQPVSGGSLNLYQIASVKLDNGDYSFVYTDAFSGCEWELGEAEIQSEELADNLEDYIAAQEAGGKRMPVRENAQVGMDGVAVFDDSLELGLYLVMQDAPADGYAKLNSFLITIPESVEGKLRYDVDALPKAGTVQKTPASDAPGSSAPAKPAASKLPQTGMLWWPIPILVISGMVLFMIGWIRRQRSGE